MSFKENLNCHVLRRIEGIHLPLCVYILCYLFSIRLQGNDADSTKVERVFDVLDKIVQEYPNSPAMKIERDERWVTWTYAEYQQDVKIAAKAFIKVCALK